MQSFYIYIYIYVNVFNKKNTKNKLTVSGSGEGNPNKFYLTLILCFSDILETFKIGMLYATQIDKLMNWADSNVFRIYV